MFEQAFKNIDDVLRKEAGCTTELDYTEQTSWLLFLKHLDGLEQDLADEAALERKKYSYILDKPYRWESWAAPKGKDGKLDHNKALTGDDLRDFVNQKLFPYLHGFTQKASGPNTIEYKIGEIFGEIKNKISSGYNMREIIGSDKIQCAANDPQERRQYYGRRTPMKVSAFGKTDQGKRRSNNEDDLALVDLSAGRALPDHAARELPLGAKGVLLAVCDGVGGRKAGEVASGLALEVLAQEMESIAPLCPKRDLFRAAVEKVNARVWQEASTDPALKGMATTLTAAVLCQRRAILAHVGDSRAYFLRGEKIRQITRDQSFVQSLIQSGALSEEDALQSPFRNVILQAIGRKTSVEVALDAIDLTSGDLLLLCTDGLSEKVRPEEMAERLSASSLSEAVESLIALANERGGEDNITALAARVEED